MEKLVLFKSNFMNARVYLFLITFSLFCLVGKAQYQHPAGKFVEADGVKLWVELEGAGEPLFLIPGGPGSSHLYLHNFSTLKDSITSLEDSNLLVFVDYYGRGKSDTANDPKAYSIERDVEDIERVRKALGFKSINILGHSFGSVIAQLYAIKYKQNVKHLIIVNGFYSGKMYQQGLNNYNRIISENQPEVWNSVMELRKNHYLSSDPKVSEAFQSLPGLIYNYNPENQSKRPEDTTYPNDFNSKLYYQFSGTDGDFILGNDLAKFNVTSLIKNLEMPVLIIAGRYDRFCSPKLSTKYKNYCPQASFVMLEKLGHFPQDEEPETLYTELKEF